MDGQIKKQLTRIPLLALILLPPPTEAAALRIDVRSEGHSGPQVDAILRASPVGQQSDRGAQATESVRSPIRIPGEASVSLPEGAIWKLELEADGYWSEPLVVVVQEDESHRMDMHPTGWVGGRLKSAPTEDPEEDLHLRFISSEHRHDETLGLRGSITCPIEKAAWRCQVPRGVFDLRLRTRGYVSHFFWDRAVIASETLDLGDQTLVRGASLVGFARTEDDSPVSKDATVRLTPRVDAPGGGAGRVRRMAQETSFSPLGFFHFDGIAPGSYVLTASHEGYAEVTVDGIVIRPEKESTLRDPLIFESPLEATFLITPPVDVSGASWQFELWKTEPSRSRARSGSADPSGNWTLAGLQPGAYELAVIDSRGERVAFEEITIDSESTSFPLDIPTIWVEGEVALGDEALVATAFFGGSSGLVSIRMSSDEEGRFAGYVPREGEWDVDVRARRPPIFRRLKKVEVKADSSGLAQVRISLPDTTLEVEVVDEGGSPIPRAQVMVMPIPALEKPSFGGTDEEGVYKVHGLDYSEYRVEAHVRRSELRMVTDPVLASLSKSAPSASVRVVARKMTKLRGRVVSAYGSGVPGVEIWFRQSFAGGSPGLVIPNARTDSTGNFVVDIASGVNRVVAYVFAPGFILKTVDLAVDSQQENVIRVDQDGGGTLVLGLEESGGATFAEEPWSTVLFDGRHDYDSNTLIRWARINGRRNSDPTKITVPFMPAGNYEICWASMGGKGNERRCDRGFLTPNGTLELLRSRQE